MTDAPLFTPEWPAEVRPTLADGPVVKAVARRLADRSSLRVELEQSTLRVGTPVVAASRFVRTVISVYRPVLESLLDRPWPLVLVLASRSSQRRRRPAPTRRSG